MLFKEKIRKLQIQEIANVAKNQITGFLIVTLSLNWMIRKSGRLFENIIFALDVLGVIINFTVARESGNVI